MLEGVPANISFFDKTSPHKFNALSIAEKKPTFAVKMSMHLFDFVHSRNIFPSTLQQTHILDCIHQKKEKN